MVVKKRPYLIVPKLIEQPTWGGGYILNIKGWTNKIDFKNKKIGQSYELFSGSKLLIDINDSEDINFTGELGSPDEDTVFNKVLYKKDIDYISLSKATSLTEKIPLIKINQSNGNSFQIHIKEDIENNRWRPKVESCYYFEDGVVTFGIKKNIDLSEYKNACLIIEKRMNELSLQAKNKEISIDKTRDIAGGLIKKINPWQYVNVHIVKKHTVGPGILGIQHSWEEDERFPQGLVNYEIQQDIMDPVSTIRCFDKGKIKDDGSVREIHIEDYFKYLDTNPDHNNIEKMIPIRQGNRLLTTEYYCLDIFEVENERTDKTNNSFSHLFVRDGAIEVLTGDGKVILTKGHSCFISETVSEYKIKPLEEKTVVLKTFINI